jgi:hypothetical protein
VLGLVEITIEKIVKSSSGGENEEERLLDRTVLSTLRSTCVVTMTGRRTGVGISCSQFNASFLSLRREVMVMILLPQRRRV